MTVLFLGLEIPEDIQQELEMICSGVPGARWVSSGQMHLTLRYLGNVERLDFDDLLEELVEIRHKPFEMSLKSVGHFPPRGEPKVLWAGVAKCPQLIELHRKLETRVLALGWDPDGRKFHPHVTLARMEDGSEARVAEFIQMNALYGSRAFQVNQFHVYSSHRTESGADYAIEETFNFE